jgi:tripartite-type tricarboxylate transporter receptor subunit TctC
MKIKKRSKKLIGCICFLMVYFSLQVSVVSLADTQYPTKQIKYIMPFTPGGPTDICARKLIDIAKKELGQEIIMEYKPGAGGLVGIRFLSNSKPDGYTIGTITSSSLLVTPFFQDVDFTYKDLTPIALFYIAEHPLAVRVDSPIKTFKDFLEEAKKREIKIAATGMATADFAMMRLADKAKINLKIVPYGGTAPSISAVLGGHADAVIQSGYYEYVRAGKLRLICLTTGMRSKEFPDIPTLKELGYDIEVVVFFGLAGPKGLPNPIRERLEKAFTKAVGDPSFATVLQPLGYAVFYKNSEDFAKYIQQEYEKAENQFRELGLGKFSKEKK